MRQSQSNKTIPILLLLLIVGAIGYFVYTKKSTTVYQQPEAPKVVTPDTKDTTTTPTPVIKKSGIKGTVISHGCGGIMPANGQISCSDSPLALFPLKIKNIATGVEKQASTDTSGNFQIELPVGKYTIVGQTNPAFTGGPFGAEVKSGVFTSIQLKFTELRP